MEATITTIGDVFRKKVEADALKSYEAPTIWVDPEGNEHVDTEYTFIVIDPTIKRNGQFYLVSPTPTEERYRYIINGVIKQIGSHVTSIIRYCIGTHHKKYEFLYKDDGTLAYPYDLRNVFRYAKNLMALRYFFEEIDKGGNYEFSIPEDIFWHCPNLMVVEGTFRGTKIIEIPENLFAKNPELEDASECFCDCQNLTDIPENLFAKNPKITTLNKCFKSTGISKIPDKLFEPFKGKINTVELDTAECFDDSKISEIFKDLCKMGSDKLDVDIAKRGARELKREGLVPKYISDSALCLMMVYRSKILGLSGK